MEKIYLSRRNLEVLLSKLDRKMIGDRTECTIIKYQNPLDPEEFIQTIPEIAVIAVENDEYYTNRPAGAVHPQDKPEKRDSGFRLGLFSWRLKRPKTHK